MKKAAMCLTVMLIAVSAHAQSKTRKVDPSLMALLNSIEVGVNKVGTAEDAIMSPGRWKAPAMLISAAKGQYETEKVSAEAVRAIVAKIKSEGVVSSTRLFSLY